MTPEDARARYYLALGAAEAAYKKDNPIGPGEYLYPTRITANTDGIYMLLSGWSSHIWKYECDIDLVIDESVPAGQVAFEFKVKQQ